VLEITGLLFQRTGLSLSLSSFSKTPPS